MDNQNSLIEDETPTGSNNTSSGDDPTNTRKPDEENALEGEAVKKRPEKASAKTASVKKLPADLNAEKKTIKRASAKKVSEIQAEAAEAKPAKVKKAAAKNPEEKIQTDAARKSKTNKQISAKKQQLAEEQTNSLTEGIALAESSPEQQQISGEHSITILPFAEPENKESNLLPVNEEANLTETQVEEVAEPETVSNHELEIQPATKGKLQSFDSVELAAQSETEQPQAATIQGEEESPAELQPAATEMTLVSSPAYSPTSAAASQQSITFQIRFHTRPGQSLFVTGNHSLLGDNNIEKAFPLHYLDTNYWSGSLEIPLGQNLSEKISYNYVLKDDDGAITVEWGKDKVIEPLPDTTREIVLIDSWNSSSFVENTFYTEPFQKVLLKDNYTEVQNKEPERITHIFKVKVPLLAKGQVLCIAGSALELGKWDTENPVLLSGKADEIWHTVSLDLTNSTFPFEYKYGIFDINTNKFIGYEDGKNRMLPINASPDKLTIVSDGFAVLPYNLKGAGVAIPVFSLRSESSFGAGEFTDIKLLVDWAKKIGLKLIQILPVNDTTATHTAADSYPYAAISAFALHPLYLHLPSLVDNDDALLSSFHEKQKELNNKAAVEYVDVMAAKWAFIKQVFPQQKQQVFESEDFKAFFNENAHWLVPYAAFCFLREKYNTADFNQWPTNQTFEAQQIKAIASSPSEDQDEVSMYYYVQYHLHLQLKDAASYAHQNGIILKGDIPIGTYRNSCDAWQEPDLFNMNLQAGAPPDNFAMKGQNWGFPTYNWQRMRENGFTWWKNRFKQMSYYFDAFRIDHILGFFRIWSIPNNAVEGIMGHFVPAVPVYINEFAERGISFDAGRYTKPYITAAVLSEIFGSDKENIITQFLDVASVTNFTLKPEFNTQKKVETYFAAQEDSEQNKKIKSGLFDLISNVILFEAEGAEGKEFHFRIAMDTTSSFRYLGGHTQYLLRELYINYFYRRQDDLWRKEALMKLPDLKRSTNMLICGEDLGMVPASVPGVMKELAILSLEIQRMPKDPSREFFHPNDAPYLSVVTPSTHDMSTIRGWWEEDRAATQRFFNNELGQWGTAPYFCEPGINKIILMQHLYSPAMWSVFQLQDLLGIDAELRRKNPGEERINIPADPKHYWRYRMHLTLEQLLSESEFNDELKGYIVQSGR